MSIRVWSLRIAPFLVAAAVSCAAIVPPAHATQWNERSTITFSTPVEIPGKVLPAGTYTFQLMNVLGNRDVVEIFNKNETKLYGVVLSVPIYRSTDTAKTEIRFSERPSNLPVALHAWFYPGYRYGQEFLYSHQARHHAAVIYNRIVKSHGLH